MAKKDKKDKGKGNAINTKSAKPLVPPKPKPNPCEVECPIYYVMDVQKCLRSPTYDNLLGPNDKFIYFKHLQQLMDFFEKLRNARERKQQRQEACVNQILERFAPYEF